MGGLPVAVTGSEDGTVRAWDLLDNRMLPEPFATHPDAVTAVQLSELDGRPAVFSADRGGGVGVREFGISR